jgi:hypothetical protein
VPSLIVEKLISLMVRLFMIFGRGVASIFEESSDPWPWNSLTFRGSRSDSTVSEIGIRGLSGRPSGIGALSPSEEADPFRFLPFVAFE